MTYTSNGNQIQKFNIKTDHEPFFFNSRGLISPALPPATLDHRWGPSENARPPPPSSQPQEDNIYQDESWQSVRSAPSPLPPYYKSHNPYFQGPSPSLHSSITYPIHSSSTHSDSLPAMAPNSPFPYHHSPSYQWPPPPPPHHLHNHALPHHHPHLPPPPPPDSYHQPRPPPPPTPPPDSYHHPPPPPSPTPPPPNPPPLYPHNYAHPPSPHHHQPHSPPPTPPPAPYSLHNNERSPDPYYGQFSHDSKFSEQFQQSTNNNWFSHYFHYPFPSPDSKYQSSHYSNPQGSPMFNGNTQTSASLLDNYHLFENQNHNEDKSLIDIRSGFNADNKEPRILLNELSTTTKNLRDQQLSFIKNLFNNSEPTDTPLTVSFFQVMPVTPKE